MLEIKKDKGWLRNFAVPEFIKKGAITKKYLSLVVCDVPVVEVEEFSTEHIWTVFTFYLFYSHQ